MTFQDIYTEYKDLVYNLALHYTQNTEDAEEVSQDVFMIIYKRFSSFNHQSQLKTWIYRIVVNKSLDYLKAKQRTKRNFFFTAKRLDNAEENVTVSHFNHPGVLLENKEATQAIFKAINTLPEKQKTVVILLRIEQRSQAEVADIMNTTVKAVESLYQRAKKKLKVKIKNEGI